MTISPQDKKALAMGLSVLMVFVVFQFVLVPTLDQKKALEKKIASQKKTLENLIALEQEYSRLSRMNMAETDILSTRARGFTLFSFLDDLAEKSGVKDNVVYMKPSSRTFNDKNYSISMVKIKLDTLYLKELVDFLHGLETSRNGVHIRSLSLSRVGNEKTMLDAVVEAETLVKGDSV